MKIKVGSAIGWVATALLVAMHLFATIMKFMPVEPGSQAEEYALAVGTVGLEHALGVLEGAILVLFIIPRTATIGFILLVGYMGGILATMLTHGLTTAEIMPIYVGLVFLAISGYFRNPELTSRLLGRR